MNPKQLEQIEAHGRNLLAIFPNATERDPVKLCKNLRRLEGEGAAVALRLCNGPEYAEGEADTLNDDILRRVNRLLGQSAKCRVPIFVNRDPRGYALKIKSQWMSENKATLHQDWGGYGIIAPEFDGK